MSNEETEREVDIFDLMGAAKTFGSGQSAAPGTYVGVVENFLKIVGHKGTTFVLEYRIKDAKGGEVDKDDKPVEPSAVGSKRSFAVNVSPGEHQAMKLGLVKKMLCSLLGKEPSEVADADFALTARKLCTAETKKSQPLRGKTFGLHCYTREKKTKPGEFHVAENFSFIKQTREELLAERALIEGAPAPAPAPAPPQ